MAAVSILKESSKLHELRGKVREAVLPSRATEQQRCMEMTPKGQHENWATFIHKKYLLFHELQYIHRCRHFAGSESWTRRDAISS